jgi:hypothetical protein
MATTQVSIVSSLWDGIALAIEWCRREDDLMSRFVRRRFAAMAAIVALAGLTAVEAVASGAADLAPWDIHVQAVDAALARGDQRAARTAWHSAYAAALGSGGWESLVKVGDASARIGGVNAESGDVERARQAYREAYVRARSERSVDGVLRVSDASARLGDHETAHLYRDAAVRLAVQRASPDIFTRIWAKLTGR